MHDTPVKIRQLYNDMLLSKSPLERLRMVSRMYDSVKKFAISGILKERQYLDPPRLRKELFLRIVGSDFSTSDRERINKIKPNN